MKEPFDLLNPSADLVSLWSGPDVQTTHSESDNSAATSLDTRALSTPSPKAKQVSTRRSTRRNRGSASRGPSADTKDKKEQAHHQDAGKKQPPSNTNVTGAAPGKYNFKPIMARDLSSVPVMFQAPNFRNIIQTDMEKFVARAPHTNHASAPKQKTPLTDNNILLTIAPQAQLNRKKRLYSQTSRVPTDLMPNQINFEVQGVQTRPRSLSDPSPAIGTLRSDQQLADYKRRRLMQHAFSQIETLVPQRFYGRASRANVLMGAVDYMVHLQSLIGQLERQLESRPGTDESPKNQRS